MLKNVPHKSCLFYVMVTKALDWYTISLYLPPKQNIPSTGNNKNSKYKIIRRWSSTYRKNVTSVELAVKECVGHNVGLGWTLKEKQEKTSMDPWQEHESIKAQLSSQAQDMQHDLIAPFNRMLHFLLYQHLAQFVYIY